MNRGLDQRPLYHFPRMWRSCFYCRLLDGKWERCSFQSDVLLRPIWNLSQRWFLLIFLEAIRNLIVGIVGGRNFSHSISNKNFVRCPSTSTTTGHLCVGIITHNHLTQALQSVWGDFKHKFKKKTNTSYNKLGSRYSKNHFFIAFTLWLMRKF